MNRLSNLVAGLLLAFGSAWLVLFLVSYLQMGALQPEVNADTGDMAPMPATDGLAAAGRRVYAANGCVACHSQQVLPGHVSADIARGWGSRRTVARDYLNESQLFLGHARLGPDLANVGARGKDAMDYHRRLYAPASMAETSLMPAYRFLYRVQKIKGQPAADALPLKGDYAPKTGYEVVPTFEAKALVAYLLSLDQSYALPEAKSD